MSIKIVCKICKNIFVDFPSRKRQYCSKKCWYEYSANVRVGDNHHNWKGGKPKCECGKLLTNYGNKSCKSCSVKGELNRNWNGGVSLRDKLERTKFRQQLHKVVLERDNYTCQLCGTGGNLQVDHIQSWVDYVDQRFNIDNCRTLCANCHYQITYGRPMPKTVKGWGHNLLRRVS